MKTKESWPIVGIVVSLVLIVRTFCPVADSPRILDANISILDSMVVEVDSLSNITEHNSRLLDFTLARSTHAGNVILSRDQLQTQLRIAYFPILAGLFGVIVSRSRYTRVGCLGVIFLAAIMYSFDVHVSDLRQREVECGTIDADAARRVMNLKPSNHYWYSITTNSLDAALKSAHDGSLKRKAEALLRPNAEQKIIFFGIPGAAVLFASIVELLRVVRKRSTTGARTTPVHAENEKLNQEPQLGIAAGAEQKDVADNASH